MTSFIRILSVIAVIAFGLVGMSYLASMKKPPEKKPLIDSRPLVAAQLIEVAPYRLRVNSQGMATPLTQTTLIAQISGKVISYSPAFNAGGFVKAGDELIRLEQSDYLTAVKSAEAQLAQAVASYQEEVARGKVALNDWKKLGKTGEAPELGLRKPQLAREEASVKSAEAELERAKRNLARTIIKAPYDALIKKRHIDIGQFVSVGTHLGEIASTDVAEIRLPVSVSDYNKLRTQASSGLQVILTQELQSGNVQFEGNVVRDEGILDNNNRMLYLVAQVNDPYQLQHDQAHASLRFGTFLQAEILGPQINQVAKVPRTAVYRNEHIYLLDDNNQLQKHTIKIIGEDKTHQYVVGDFQQGERFVTTTMTNPIPGREVRLEGEEQPVIPDDSSPANNPTETAVAAKQ